MASSQYFRIVEPNEKDFKILADYNNAKIEYYKYSSEISSEDKFLEISRLRNLLPCEESMKLYEEFYPMWIRLFMEKEKLEIIYSDELCLGKEICHTHFPEYDGIIQVSQLFSPIAKADSELIMKLRKIFSFKELAEFSEDKKLMMDFVKSNFGSYIFH
jgi:hypothetical protein